MKHTVTFVDLRGQPIDAMAWGKLFEESKPTGEYVVDETVYQTPVGLVVIRTAWGGLVIPDVVQPYGTATATSLDGPWIEVEEYATLAEARAGHRKWTGQLAPAPTEIND